MKKHIFGILLLIGITVGALAEADVHEPLVLGKAQCAEQRLEVVKDGEADDENISELVLSIKEKSEKIDKLKAEVNSAKNKRICPKCGAAIDKISNYCNACGEKLFYDSEEDKTEE